MTIMMQIGSFVPASAAYMPIVCELFARASVDDSVEANMSTFSSEMREISFILRNVSNRSMVIIDELGRGTSCRDGLAIALAIAEGLVGSGALVWFVTHFTELGTIMAERNGVVSLHLAVDITNDADDTQSMNMRYKVASGVVRELHYGLALARVMPLPAEVLKTAEELSSIIERKKQIRKNTSSVVILERRRKLILNLKESLDHARKGSLEGRALAEWLEELQNEFVRRMVAIDEEAKKAEEPHDDEDEVIEGNRPPGEGYES